MAHPSRCFWILSIFIPLTTGGWRFARMAASLELPSSQENEIVPPSDEVSTQLPPPPVSSEEEFAESLDPNFTLVSAGFVEYASEPESIEDELRNSHILE